MANPIHPQVVVTEQSDGLLIPQVDVDNGATVFQSTWGPADEVHIVRGESELVSLFGKPNDITAKDFLVTSSFLAYTNNLRVVRKVSDDALNATAQADQEGIGLLIRNEDEYTATSFTASLDLWVAKYPGALGNNIGVAWIDELSFGEVDSNGQYIWQFHDLFYVAPGEDEFHIVVFDATGQITGAVGSVLETYPFVSTVPTATNQDGTSNYFKTRINNNSSWVYVGNTQLLTGMNSGVEFGGGNDGTEITDGDRIDGFDLFLDKNDQDISLIFQGAGGIATGVHIIHNIASVRKDCVAFVSPLQSDVVGNIQSETLLNNILQTRSSYGSSSYAVMDSAYKWAYDRYNDVYRWIPLNGDIAGLCAKVDSELDPWISPAGRNRGHIKGAAKLTKVPSSILDDLYANGINPCYVDGIEGAILAGDKTLLTRPDLFGYINVRRLFIVIEKAISESAKYVLHEPNDEITRTRFVNTVEPYLKDVQGRRGVIWFNVRCDRTNNPDQLVAEGKMIVDIVIQPTVSIQYVFLNFTATKSSVDVTETVSNQL